MADRVFDDPRLAAVYDPLDPDRSDLDLYLGLVDELGARSVLDIGCGTGTFACLLARRGIEVVGLDPAAASLDVARSKPGAERVRWVHGDLGALPSDVRVDLATMTANVAQVFLTDEEWRATLERASGALIDHGRLVFETRDPAKQAWTRWNERDSRVRVHVPGIGMVESWHELGEVRMPFVSFRSTVFFHDDGTRLISESTLRFRTRSEVEASLEAAGLVVESVRDAPDRPGLELVFVARRATMVG